MRRRATIVYVAFVGVVVVFLSPINNTVGQESVAIQTPGVRAAVSTRSATSTTAPTATEQHNIPGTATDCDMHIEHKWEILVVTVAPLVVVLIVLLLARPYRAHVRAIAFSVLVPIAICGITYFFFGAYLLGLLFVLFLFLYAIVMACAGFMTSDEEERQEITNELKFFFLDISPGAWYGSGAIGSLLAALFLLWTTEAVAPQDFRDACGLLITVTVTALGLHVFYRRTAPISDVEANLERITRDLIKYSTELSDPSMHESRRFWFVFPTLNIGYYRLREKSTQRDRHWRLPDDSLYGKFFSKLNEVVRTLESKAIAVVYDPSYYEKLFTRYEEQITDEQQRAHELHPQRLAQWSKEAATSFVKEFKANEASPQTDETCYPLPT
jgi:hypothetical protein